VNRLLSIAGLVVVASCRRNLSVDERTFVTCADDALCPEATHCVALVHRCVSDANTDVEPPTLSSVTLSPSRGGRNTRITAEFVVSEGLGLPPALDAFHPTLVDATLRRYTFEHLITGDEQEGDHSVEVTLVDSVGNKTSANLGTFTIDLTPPRIQSLSAVDERTVQIVFDEALAAEPTAAQYETTPALAVTLVSLSADRRVLSFITAPQLATQRYALALQVSDEVGNSTALSAEFTGFGATIDRTPPSIIAPPPYGKAHHLKALLVWSGKLQARSYSVDVTLASDVAYLDPIPGSPFLVADGSTSLEVSLPEARTYRFRVRADTTETGYGESFFEAMDDAIRVFCPAGPCVDPSDAAGNISKPYRTLYRALLEAVSQDHTRVEVAARPDGSAYEESVTLAPGVDVVGGFDELFSGSDPVLRETAIKAQYQSTVNAFGLNDLTRAVTLSNVTVHAPREDNAVAISVLNTSNALTLRHVKVVGPTGVIGGATTGVGVKLINSGASPASGPLFDQVTIRSGTATNAIALSAANSALRALDSTFIGEGGGIQTGSVYADRSQIELAGCLLTAAGGTGGTTGGSVFGLGMLDAAATVNGGTITVGRSGNANSSGIYTVTQSAVSSTLDLTGVAITSGGSARATPGNVYGSGITFFGSSLTITGGSISVANGPTGNTATSSVAAGIFASGFGQTPSVVINGTTVSSGTVANATSTAIWITQMASVALDDVTANAGPAISAIAPGAVSSSIALQLEAVSSATVTGGSYTSGPHSAPSGRTIGVLVAAAPSGSFVATDATFTAGSATAGGESIGFIRQASATEPSVTLRNCTVRGGPVNAASGVSQGMVLEQQLETTQTRVERSTIATSASALGASTALTLRTLCASCAPELVSSVIISGDTNGPSTALQLSGTAMGGAIVSNNTIVAGAAGVSGSVALRLAQEGARLTNNIMFTRGTSATHHCIVETDDDKDPASLHANLLFGCADGAYVDFDSLAVPSGGGCPASSQCWTNVFDLNDAAKNTQGAISSAGENLSAANLAAVGFANPAIDDFRLTANQPAGVMTGGRDTSELFCGPTGANSCGAAGVDRLGVIRVCATPLLDCFAIGAFEP
jgi:hypothetical protein